MRKILDKSGAVIIKLDPGEKKQKEDSKNLKVVKKALENLCSAMGITVEDLSKMDKSQIAQKMNLPESK